MRDPANLDARAVILERILDPAFDGAIVAALFHVDEVDDDEAGKIAQAQLAGDFISRLQIGAQRRVFNIMFAGRPARIDVDGDQRLGLVDDDIAAGLQGHDIGEHGVKLGLGARLGEERLQFAMRLNILGMARHEHAHEVLGLAVAILAGHDHFVDVLVVEVADGALDQRAFLVDEAGCGGFQRQFAHRLPHAQEIFEVAADLGFRAGGTGGAQDNAHAFRHFQLARNPLEALAVGGVGDLARDAAATCGVGHQHGIAAGKRQIGGQGRALVAALFLDNLHQQHLAALDDFLDLVLATQALVTVRHVFHGVAANVLDMFFLVVFTVFVIVLIVARGAGRRCVALFGARLVIGLDGDIGVAGEHVVMMPGRGIRHGELDVGDREVERQHRSGRVVAARDDFAVDGLAMCSIGVGRGFRNAGVGAGALFIAATAARAALLVFLIILIAMRARFFFQKGEAVGDRDLVIIGMDFREGEEAVAVAAIFNEGGLQRGFDPRHFCQIDIAAQLLAVGSLEVEFLYAVTT